jgi:hypothetical protein
VDAVVKVGSKFSIPTSPNKCLESTVLRSGACWRAYRGLISGYTAKPSGRSQENALTWKNRKADIIGVLASERYDRDRDIPRSLSIGLRRTRQTAPLAHTLGGLRLVPCRRAVQRRPPGFAF